MHYNGDNTCLGANRKEIYKFKADNKNMDFPTQFCLRSISNKFDSDDIKEVSFTGNVYDFSVDYNVVDKCDILNIHKYLLVKNKTYNNWVF